MTLLEEIQNGETEMLEFKREISSKDSKLMKTVVAFSNCHGRLYGGLTIEKMLKGSSSIRNELVADTFLRMGIVEKWGTGIKRIADLCHEHGLGEVEYSSDDESFTAIIRRTRKDLFGENVPKTSPEMSLNVPLSDREKSILTILSKKNDSTAKDISNELGVTEKTIKRDIAELKAKHILERVGGKNGGHWIIKNNSEKE